jgi:hypothetical protein
MPGARGLLVALALGTALGVYVALWIRVPTFLAVGIGAFVTLVTLLVAASVGDDPADADAAWRGAAPDLVERRPGPDADTQRAPGTRGLVG